MTFGVDFGSVTPPDVGVEPEVVTKASSFIPISTGINAYVNVLKALLPAAGGFSSYDVFWLATPTASPLWVFGGEVTSGAGTFAEAAIVASQISISFRTERGGRFHVQLMETGAYLNTVLEGVALTGNPTFGPLCTYLVGNTSIVVGRDGGSLSSAIRSMTKTNDKLRRAYLV
jgi:hypothetical protein